MKLPERAIPPSIGASRRFAFQRFVIPTFLVLLSILLAGLGRTLWLDLEELSTAGSDNAQWTVLQLDTEFANLQSTLLEQSQREQPSLTAIRLRTDITLSRIGIVGSGTAAEIIATNERAVALLREIERYAAEAAALVDGDLAAPDIERLTELTIETAPLARELALLGISIGAERTEARRMEFARKLRNKGLVAIVVLAALAAVLVLLNRLLWIAREKDEALRASSRRLASTVSASLDAIVTSNGEGEILDFNPAAERIFGWSRDDMVGRDIGALLPEARRAEPCMPESGDRFTEYLGRGRIEIFARRSTGEEFPADLTVTSIGSDSGDLVIIYLRDISEQKLNEQALIEAKERAERTDRAKSRFLTVMSHEMRTPLNGMLGVLDLLRATEPTRRQARYLDVATASSEVLMTLVNEALDIARIETGALTLSPHRFSLAEEVRRVTAFLEPLAREKNLDFTVRIDPRMELDLVGDATRIGQIITNLVGNAIKFTASGSVTVTVSGIHTAKATAATIAVRDTGAGIPSEHVEAIFEDFVALSHSEGRMSRGDGLGLSISRKTARLMGGDITVSLPADGGSEFSFTLPLQRAALPPLTASVQSEASNRQQGSESALRVLIVEDNDVNRAVLQEMLEGLGHAATVASDSIEGFELALKQPFDLIFMDINMPDPDGIDLTRRLRAADGPNQTTRIHGLTAYGEEEYLALATSAGMDGFSTKPIRMQELASILRGEAAVDFREEYGSGNIDLVVLDDLRDALGEERMRETAEKFFREMRQTLTEMKQMSFPADRKEFRARLHDLGGAAALFGLRALTEGTADARSAAKTPDFRSVEPLLDRLEQLAAETYRQLFDLLAARKTAGVG